MDNYTGYPEYFRKEMRRLHFECWLYTVYSSFRIIFLYMCNFRHRATEVIFLNQTN